MRAILINPQDQTITEVDYTGDYKNIYEHIDADCFDCVSFGDKERHTIFVDDNGLNNGKALQVGMFRVDGEYPAYLAGKGLILATDDEGESVAATMTLEYLNNLIAFGECARMGSTIIFFEHDTGRYWRVE